MFVLDQPVSHNILHMIVSVWHCVLLFAIIMKHWVSKRQRNILHSHLLGPQIKLIVTSQWYIAIYHSLLSWLLEIGVEWLESSLWVALLILAFKLTAQHVSDWQHSQVPVCIIFPYAALKMLCISKGYRIDNWGKRGVLPFLDFTLHTQRYSTTSSIVYAMTCNNISCY